VRTASPISALAVENPSRKVCQTFASKKDLMAISESGCAKSSLHGDSTPAFSTTVTDRAIRDLPLQEVFTRATCKCRIARSVTVVGKAGVESPCSLWCVANSLKWVMTGKRLLTLFSLPQGICFPVQDFASFPSEYFISFASPSIKKDGHSLNVKIRKCR